MASAPTSADVAVARAAAGRPLAAAVAGDRALPARLRTADWSAGTVEEGGQFHRVLVLPGVGAVRMTRSRQAAERLADRMAVLRCLATTAALPLALPVPLTEVVGFGDGLAAVVQQYLPGGAHPPHTGDPAVLRELCAVLARIDTAPFADRLGPPFAFRGPWTPRKVAAVQALPERLARTYGTGVWTGAGAAAAERWGGTVAVLTERCAQWTAQPVVRPTLVHGDLAGHNMRWQPATTPDARPDGGGWAGAPARGLGGRQESRVGDRPGDGTGRRTRGHGVGDLVLTGILDWDLATVWDPALNPAYLALWHGEEKLESIARDAGEALRGRVWLGSMALESVYDASLREGTDHPAAWGKLLRKVLPRIERALAAEEQWRAGTPERGRT
jgi:aminoglycoside phosphotransferase (APT) family kinase protein